MNREKRETALVAVLADQKGGGGVGVEPVLTTAIKCGIPNFTA